MKTNYFKLIVSVAFFACSFSVTAKENVGMTSSGGTTTPSTGELKSVTSVCQNATQQIDLDINNVRAKILNGGDMWWDIFNSGNARYQVPKPASTSVVGPSSQFASSVWVGGFDSGGQLKEAAQTYRQSGNDYWPGPLKADATTDYARCLAYDKFWKINRDDVQKYYDWCVGGQVGVNPILSSSTQPAPMGQITDWPAFGPEGQHLAPFFSPTGDYTSYDPTSCTVPDFDVTGTRACGAQLYGDQCIFWVFNDQGNIHTETGGEAIGLEIQAQAFAFKTNDEINNATFYKYKIINKSSYQVNETYFGLWDDADLGIYSDDFVGCDVTLGLGILFNGVAVDGTGQSTAYGVNPPAVGVDFFYGPKADTLGANGQDRPANSVPPSFVNYGDDTAYNERLGMCKFMYFNNNSNAVNGNPGGGFGGSINDYYQYLSGFWKNGAPITYGGDGTTGSVVCDYMFPGTSDPNNFGTHGVPMSGWDETTSHNTPADRRFLESAGPFTLLPGAVNYITIGVPWARATSGGNLASVALLKGADAKAQNLFNNCFSTLNGPKAPTLTVQELDKQLILYWTNPKGSNNYLEKYVEDYNHSSGLDSAYRFQGYIVYQLKDASVSITDLYNPDKARMIGQCDKKDGITQIVNYSNNVALSAMVPQEMVNGADKGIFHSLKVTTDQFATGDNTLINHKSYYFAVIAYGFSSTQNPVLGVIADYSPFISGRQYDPPFYHVAIPHIPSPEGFGTSAQSGYGSGPSMVRLEGQGNGGNILDLSSSTVEEILSASSGYRSEHPVYTGAHGPATITVIDPLNVPENNDFQLLIYPAKSRGNISTGLSDSIVANSTWALYNKTTGDTVHSETSIQIPNEQIINGQISGTITPIPTWGLSVNVVNTTDPGTASTANNAFTAAVNNGFLEATIEFGDPSRPWLTGVKDAEGEDEANWIRSGTFSNTSDHAFDDYGNYHGIDDGQVYEKLLEGTVAPYRLAAYTTTPTGTNPITYVGGPVWSNAAMGLNKFANLASVNIVITNDRSKWSRCPVIEVCEQTTLAVGGVKKMSMRSSLSVDKNGYNSTQAGYNAADGDLNGTTGMGWFPGYAINLETGERLNMAFAEDSWLTADNGSDMKWNPTSKEFDATQSIPQADGFNLDVPIFGGKHYIYVFGHNANQTFTGDPIIPNGYPKNCPRYDEGAWMNKLFAAAGPVSAANNQYQRQIFSDAMWVAMPMVAEGYSLMENDVKIRLRVAKSYQKGYAAVGTTVLDSNLTPVNRNFPVYDFNSSDIGTRKGNADAAASALDLVNVVPNPYYAYSGYELKTGDNIVKITNVPTNCTITIYSLGGTLVRTIKVAQDANAQKNINGIGITSVDWDLKNNAKVPIASGMYIIHIDVPNVGEKTLKWFGVLRPLDLDAY